MEPFHGNTLAVMETQGELQVVLPSTLSEAAYARFLDQFTNFQDITFGKVEELLLCALVAFLQRLPNINDGTEQELLPVTWDSNNLRRVSLGLYLKGHKEDTNFYRIWDWLSREELDNIKACTTDISIALAPMFLEQLNSQFELRELEPSFNNRLHPRLSPFLQLSLDPAHGLPRLSNLKKLEKLVITGLAHRLGQKEIVWMSQNWPRLRRIEVPIIDHWIDPTEAVSCTRHSVSVGQEMVAPEYDQWFLQLHVVIPIDCHSCGKCLNQHCPCRGFYEAGNINHEELLEREDYMIEADYWEAEEMEADLTVELEYEAYLIDSFDDLYLGRHHQHRSSLWPNPKRR
ncbi:hypothetical protein CPB97_006905 [Podila verticillata]|nr:hypothetical protein CPB97_006905 [Podila verticillata]